MTKIKRAAKWLEQNWGYLAGYLVVYAAILVSLNAGIQKQDEIAELEAQEAHRIMVGACR
jgi:hypothetical protein